MAARDPHPRPRRRRRDRHGRGLRGPISPPQVPLSRTRSERFDDLVLDGVEVLERQWEKELASVEFAVEDVPPIGPGSPAATEGRVPLGRSFAATRDLAPRVVLYRRPIEARAAEPGMLAELVHDVLVEQVADLLGLTPEQVDPDYGEEAD